jgi:hypothetical protein
VKFESAADLLALALPVISVSNLLVRPLRRPDSEL